MSTNVLYKNVYKIYIRNNQKQVIIWVSTSKRTDKFWNIYIMNYYSSLKKKLIIDTCSVMNKSQKHAEW